MLADVMVVVANTVDKVVARVATRYLRGAFEYTRTKYTHLAINAACLQRRCGGASWWGWISRVLYGWLKAVNACRLRYDAHARWVQNTSIRYAPKCFGMFLFHTPKPYYKM